MVVLSALSNGGIRCPRFLQSMSCRSRIACSMPWSRPAVRREFVWALRGTWASWDEGERLHGEGEFYEHLPMAPFFAGVDHGTVRHVLESPLLVRR